jgi:hypothetical protein
MSELVFSRVVLEKNNQILAVLVLASFTINILLTGLLVSTVHRPPIIVTKEADQLVVLNEENYKLDEEGLIEFARLIAKNYLSFTPESLPSQIEGISEYLTDEPRNSILDSYKNPSATVKKDDIRFEFRPDAIRIVKKSIPFQVELGGTRTIFVNDNSKSFPAIFIFEIKRVKTSVENPYGLKVLQIYEKNDQRKGKKK